MNFQHGTVVVPVVRGASVVATARNNTTVATPSTSAHLIKCNSSEIAWVDLLVNQKTLIGEPEDIITCIKNARVLSGDKVRKNKFVEVSL